MLRLNEGIEYWKALPRNNQEELQVADDYFDEQLMPLSLELFLLTQQSKKKKSYYGMMLTLGTSWQPLALSISLLQPKKILVMYTEDTVWLLQKLKDFLQLDDSKITVALVNRSEADAIYSAMRDFYRDVHNSGDICVDITGGTKAMSSSAAMMAAVLGLDIYYVESKYLPLYRRPLPGSEELKSLGNPSL